MSLVAHYKLNDNAASTATLDSSGNGYHGTAARNTEDFDASGKINGALDFNGSSDFIECPVLNIPFPMSVFFWAYVSNSSPVLVAKRSNSYYSWELATSNGTLLCRVNSNSYAATGSAYSSNTWTHLGMTYDGSAIRAWSNSSVVGSYNYTTAITSSAVPIAIGARKFYTGAEAWFDGMLDDVRIYNTALTASQVKSIYRLGGGTEDSYPWARRLRLLTGAVA